MQQAPHHFCHDHRWQQGSVIYQVYPRSFQDSNNDGIGDLPGIISRLDYLKDLGVSGIWLSPFYPSPMVDFGYDISDYCDVDPIFGTLQDFKELLRKAHSRDIKVLIDLVANHTSDQHEWFKESRSSKANSKADWYVWKDPKTDQAGRRLPPNNWREALTGNTAWEWDEARQQYYLHSWHKSQPDLNWSNKEVRRAIKDVMRFWLDLGVDGFRADAVDWIAKDPLFRDDIPNPDYHKAGGSPYDALAHNNSRGWPTEYAYLAEMIDVFEEAPYKNRHPFIIAETYQEKHNPAEAYAQFYGGLDPELAAPFNFEGIYMPWEASEWRSFLASFYGKLSNIHKQAVPCYAFGNHDNRRLVSRLGEGNARSAALLQMTLPGMSIIYYGEEIGMHDVSLPKFAMHDPYHNSRDPYRTPMQWSPGKNSGFSGAEKTWLPLAADYKRRNVEVEKNNRASFYNFYRELILLRNRLPSLCHGNALVLDAKNPDVLCFVRIDEDKGKHCVVLINFSNKPALCVLGVPIRELLLSTKLDTKLTDLRKGTDGQIELLAYEAALFL